MKLYTYYRSSAAYRVRIALNLKQLEYEAIPVHLRKREQREPEFLALNPQGLVPLLEDEQTRLTQSMAILEYLEEQYPEPALLPEGPLARAQVRASAQLIACDIHPLNNLRVLRYLRSECGQSQDQVDTWYRHWVQQGFAALEELLQETAGDYCHGDTITVADVCLVPQVYNAQRLECDLCNYPILNRINHKLLTHPAVAAAAPERQPDAE